MPEATANLPALEAAFGVASKFAPVLAVTSTAINVTSLGIAIHEYFQTMDYVAQRKPFLDAMTEKSQNALQDALNNNALKAENAQAGESVSNGEGAAVEGEEAEPSRPGKMNQEVKKGQAPKDVDRVDKGHIPGQEPHVHYKDGTSSTPTGRVHDAHKGTPNPSKNTIDWLNKHKWKAP